MKKIFLLAVAASTLLACSNNDLDLTTDTGDKPLAMSVYLSKVTDRAISDAAQNGATINSLQVRVLTTEGAQIGGVHTFNSSSTPTLTTLITGSVADDANIIVEKVSSTASSVEVRGYNNATAPASWEALSTIDAKSVNAIQSYAFENIPFISTTGVDGKDIITKGTDLNGNERKKWTAEPSIKPYFARFEVSGTPILYKEDGSAVLNDGTTIVVNNIYMNAVGNKTGGVTTYGNTGGNWTYDGTSISGTSGNWEAGYYTNFADMYGDAPTGAQVQAFNLWSQATMPHVILKVTVTPKGDAEKAYAGFVTIKNFTATGVSGIVNGNIYSVNLGDLHIKYNSETGGGDIDPNPEDVEADLHLKVTVLPWVKVNLTPGM